MIKLGDKALDTVTGFKGIVVGKTEFLNGCTRVCLQPPVDPDGKIPECHWFDEPQLQVITAEKVPAGPRNVGGPMISVPTRNAPPR